MAAPGAVPGVTSGDSFDGSRREGGGPPDPDPIPQCQLIDLQLSGERAEEKREGTGEHQSAVALDVEHRALQRLRSSLSAPPPALLQLLWAHPKLGEDNLAAIIEVKAQPGTFLPSTTASHQFTLEGQSCPTGIPGLSPPKKDQCSGVTAILREKGSVHFLWLLLREAEMSREEPPGPAVAPVGAGPALTWSSTARGSQVCPTPVHFVLAMGQAFPARGETQTGRAARAVTQHKLPWLSQGILQGKHTFVSFLHLKTQ